MNAILEHARLLYEVDGQGTEFDAYLGELSSRGFRGFDIRLFCDGRTTAESLGEYDVNFFVVEGSSEEFIAILSGNSAVSE